MAKRIEAVKIVPYTTCAYNFHLLDSDGRKFGSILHHPQLKGCPKSHRQPFLYTEAGHCINASALKQILEKLEERKNAI